MDMGTNHGTGAGATRDPEFGLGDANAYRSQISKMPSEFTKTRHFKREIIFPEEEEA